MKAPPLIPQTLGRFLAIGIGVSLLTMLLASFVDPYVPNQWVHMVPGYGSLGSRALHVSVTLTLGLSALWAAVYLSCWPYLYFRYWSEKRARPIREKLQAEIAQAEAERAKQAQQLRERVQMGGPPSAPSGPPAIYLPAEGESWESRDRRFAEAKALHAQCLQQVEEKVLTAFARYSLNSDFFGAVPQQDLFRAFGAKLDKLGIFNVGILHESKNPTIRRLMTYAPIMHAELSVYDRIKPYRKPYELPPDSPLIGPFIKRYISGR